MKSNNINVENIINFQNRLFTEAMEWATNSIFSPLWMDPDFMKCAKGGNEKDSYANKSDMFYLIHIFSGTAMALKVFDYKYLNKNPEEEIENITKKLKRSIFGYLFHDFNKLSNYEENKYMRDKSELDTQLEKFSSIMAELELSKDDVYFIAFATEKGTQYISNSIDVSLEHNLQFESSFSRLADTLSSIFSDNNDNIKDIYFNNAPCIPKSRIQKINITNTTFITTSSFLKKIIIQNIEKNNGFYLWSTLNSIYYVRDTAISLDVKILANELTREIGIKAHLENGITLTDRKIDISSSNIGSINKEILLKFVADGTKFKQVLHLENIPLRDEMRHNAEIYSDHIANLESFSINFHKDMPENKKRTPRSVREYVEAETYYDSNSIDMEESGKIQERLHAFYIRYVQLKTTLKSEQAYMIRNKLDDILDDNISILENFLPKNNKSKSAFLIPLLLAGKENNKINWDNIESDILTDINAGSKSENNEEIVSEIINIILNVNNINLPAVPDKISMSMISGYPAKTAAHIENLFGLGTNSFNNRLPTSGISNGKIDPYTIYEFSLRHVLAPKVGAKYSSAILFLSFPGAIPFMNMDKFLKLSSNVESDLKVNNIVLTLDDANAKLDNFLFDSTYYIYLNDPKKDSDILRYLVNVIEIALRSKLHALLSFSNNIFYNSWNETILVELESSLLNGMRWNKIRCNNISLIKKEIYFFLNAARKNNKFDYDNASVIIKDYLRDNFSLSYYVHGQFFNGYHNILSGKDKIDLMRKLVYGNKGDKMEKIEKLGETAAELRRLPRKSSGSERGWMVRDSLEVMEKMKAETKINELSDLKDFVSGYMSKNLERLLKRDRPDLDLKPHSENILQFTDLLFSLINEEFKGKIPAGITRSYLVDAFEIEYELASDMKRNKSD
ncbi:hypothetical protein [Ferroplasma acidiphilum]|nr:hypothetical protein [Ferroplasma acidiphilum]